MLINFSLYSSSAKTTGFILTICAGHPRQISIPNKPGGIQTGVCQLGFSRGDLSVLSTKLLIQNSYDVKTIHNVRRTVSNLHIGNNLLELFAELILSFAHQVTVACQHRGLRLRLLQLRTDTAIHTYGWEYKSFNSHTTHRISKALVFQPVTRLMPPKTV